jgi:hypothetical protein
MRVTTCKRIYRKKSSNSSILHSVLKTNRVSFPLHFVIHFLSLEAVDLPPSKFRFLHSKKIRLYFLYFKLKTPSLGSLDKFNHFAQICEVKNTVFNIRFPERIHSGKKRLIFSRFSSLLIILYLAVDDNQRCPASSCTSSIG